MNGAAPTCLVRKDGSLTEAAILFLHAFTQVDEALLSRACIRRSSSNWLRAPWYPYHRGGGITIGRTIWFNRKWFDANGYGDSTVESTWQWALILAHEVGHLPQAERYGRSFFGKLRYVSAFTGQYTWRAITLRRQVHDRASLELEADRGRKALVRVIGEARSAHPLIKALHTGDEAQLRLLLAEQRPRIEVAWPATNSDRLSG